MRIVGVSVRISRSGELGRFVHPHWRRPHKYTYTKGDRHLILLYYYYYYYYSTARYYYYRIGNRNEGLFSYTEAESDGGWLVGWARVGVRHVGSQTHPPLLSCHAAEIDSDSRWWFLPDLQNVSGEITLRPPKKAIQLGQDQSQRT